MVDMNKAYKVDETLAHEGKWFDLPMGGRAKVAPWNSPAFNKRLEALRRPHRRAIRNDSFTEEQARAIMAQAIPGAILFDWSDIEIDGEPLPYSETNARKLLLDFPLFYDAVIEIARDTAAFLEEDAVAEMEEAGKNSESTSSGA